MARKQTLIVTFIGSVAVAAAVVLRNNEARARTGRVLREMYAKITHRTASENRISREMKIGLSHPSDFEDNEMVSEGALTSVQYYNEKQLQS